MTQDEHLLAELATVKGALTGLDGRLEQVEQQLASVLLSVLKGLKGSDDGQTDGLYESVRKLRSEQAHLHSKIESLAATVAEHEKDKNQVVGGGKAIHLLVVLGSGLIAWIVTHFGK